MNKVILTVDLGYGDCGKGTTVDFLTRHHKAHMVVRYNGGAQAAHNVVTPEGLHHTFAQFGSGTLAGASTFLSRYVLVEPFALLAEGQALEGLGVRDVFAQIAIDENAPIITRYQQASNRLKEMMRGEGRHGSCGMGVGETASDVLTYGDKCLFAKDLSDPAKVTAKLEFLRKAKFDELFEVIEKLQGNPFAQSEIEVFEEEGRIPFYAQEYPEFARKVKIVGKDYLKEVVRAGTVIFEGAQGVLLDEWYGFHPYTTWSTITFENADKLLEEAGFEGEVKRLGIMRAYQTRHGAGPFVTESEELTRSIPDSHNGLNPWQREFRVGYLDLVATRYAYEVVGYLDGLVVTNLDRLSDCDQLQVCDSYECPKSPVFEQKRGKTYIKVNRNHDLEWQESITNALFAARPKYAQISPKARRLSTRQNHLIRKIEASLHLPVVLTSFGPTANDKRVLPLYSFSWESIRKIVREALEKTGA